MIEILNEGNFPEKVLQAPHKVLVEFFAAWCPHCQRMMPIIDDVADAAAGRVAVYQVDIDQSPAVRRRLRGGKPRGRAVQAASAGASGLGGFRRRCRSRPRP